MQQTFNSFEALNTSNGFKLRPSVINPFANKSESKMIKIIIPKFFLCLNTSIEIYLLDVHRQSYLLHEVSHVSRGLTTEGLAATGPLTSASNKSERSFAFLLFNFVLSLFAVLFRLAAVDVPCEAFSSLISAENRSRLLIEAWSRHCREKCFARHAICVSNSTSIRRMERSLIATASKCSDNLIRGCCKNS